jgi:hypothetical protein
MSQPAPGRITAPGALPGDDLVAALDLKRILENCFREVAS